MQGFWVDSFQKSVRQISLCGFYRPLLGLELSKA